MATRTVEVEVDVEDFDVEDLSSEELINELIRRVKRREMDDSEKRRLMKVITLKHPQQCLTLREVQLLEQFEEAKNKLPYQELLNRLSC